MALRTGERWRDSNASLSQFCRENGIRCDLGGKDAWAEWRFGKRENRLAACARSTSVETMARHRITRVRSPQSFRWLPWTLLLVLAGPSASATPSGQDQAEWRLDELVVAVEIEGCAPRNTRDATELMRRFKKRINRRFDPEQFANTTIELDDGRLVLSLDMRVGGVCIPRKQTFVVETVVEVPPCEFE